MISMASAFDWTDGMVSYYSFEDDLTTTNVIDITGSNDGTLTNAGNTADISASGKINLSLDLDGTNDFIDLNSNFGLSGTNTGSFSLWFNGVAASSRGLITTEGDVAVDVELRFDGTAGDRVIFGINGSYAVPSSALNTTGWHHAVGTYDGTNIRIYYDGVLKDTEARVITFPSQNFIIGVDRNTAGRYFDGKIDEVGIWNRSLSQAEITELYNDGDGLAYDAYDDTEGVPTVTLDSPINASIISDVGTNFTVSGSNLSDVAGEWVNVTYNVWQNSTLVNSTTVDFTDNITFNETLYIDNFGFKDYEWNAEACYTNVTGDYCVNATNNNTFSVSLFTIISESYINDTVSGTLENFSISIDLLEGYSLTAASFMYNGTDNSPSITAEGDNRFLLVSDYQIPILTTDQNISFYWGMTFTGDITLNSTERTQLVRAVLLDNCSLYTFQLFNISLFDEELKTSLVGDIEITYTLLNMPSYQTINTYSFEQNDISNVGVCSGINLSAEGLAYSAEIRYVSDDYAPELYHIQRASTGTGIQSINLFDLHDNESTEFKLTYQDDTFNFVAGAIIQLQRKYISEGIYEVVEAPLTSRDGVAVLHVDLNSIKYKATVVKNGVVLDIFDNLVFKCESELTGECTQKLLGGINPQNSKEVANLIDFSYLISSVNNTITTTFTIPSGTSSLVNILLVQVDNFGTTTLCNSTVISSAGSIDCTYNDTIGDSRVFLTISKDGVIVVNQGYFIPENINLGFAGNNYIIVLLLLLTLVGMAFASPEWIVIIGVVAFFIAGGLWLLNGMNLVIGLGTMMFVVIAVAILIKEMTKQEDQ